jgi:predicted RNase H-like nuclease
LAFRLSPSVATDTVIPERSHYPAVFSHEFLGVDRCPDGWLAVGYSRDDVAPDAAVYDDIGALWDAHAGAARIVVGVPIGLRDRGDDADSRRCDDLARAVVGPRHRSVVTAPSRPAVERIVTGATPVDVSQTNRGVTGEGLSPRARRLAPAVHEVDQLLRAGDGDPTVLVEGHPELAFRAFHHQDLAHSKGTAVGTVERTRVLRAVPEYGHGDWTGLVDSLRERGQDAGLDDLLDAVALALTAMAPADEVQRLPRDPSTDGEGLPVQMVYRRAEPFDVDA